MILYICPFAVPETLMPHITPVYFFYAPHPTCIRVAIFLSDPPSACTPTVDLKYLNSPSYFTISPFISTTPSSCPTPALIRKYSVFCLLTFIPLTSIASRHISSLCSTSSFVSAHTTTSSARGLSLYLPHHIVNNNRKRERAQGHAMVQSHRYFKLLCITRCTSHQCFAVLIHVLY